MAESRTLSSKELMKRLEVFSPASKNFSQLCSVLYQLKSLSTFGLSSFPAPCNTSLLMAAIVRESLTEKVYTYLLGMLAARNVKIGARLSARTITDELNVSRTTVNKAFERLTEAGWLKLNDKGRPVVANYPPKKEATPRNSEFDFSNQTDSTYEALLERILRGDYQPGEVIKERPLANDLQVNPATVRRAAEWLRNDGLLVRMPRRGWRVANLDTRDVRDIYQIRLLLEPLAMEGAIHRIKDELLDELEAECDRLIAAGEKATAYDRRRADYNFHRTLCESSGSKVLVETLDPLIRKLLLITTVGFRYGRASRSFEEHKAILQGLRKRDPAEAVQRIKGHLRTALKFNIDAWEIR
jgi:DNA-binding GntR family transcriptional regulator